MAQALPATEDSSNGLVWMSSKRHGSARLLKTYDKIVGINWTWQSLDSISIKVALGRAIAPGNNPTEQGQTGTTRHILTDKKGIPLSAVISSASNHDIKMATNVVDSMVIKRPSSPSKPKAGRRERRRLQQHLCLDKAYNSEPEEQELLKRGYVLHMPHRERKEKRLMNKKQKWQHITKDILPRDGL